MFNKGRRPEGVENNRASAGANMTKTGSLETPKVHRATQLLLKFATQQQEIFLNLTSKMGI